MARERIAHQAAAIAGGGAEHVAVQAAGMHAHQHALLAGHVAAHQGQVALGVQVAAVGDGAEFAELGFDGAFRQRGG